MRSMKKSYTEYNLMMVRRTITMATMMLHVMMMTMMVIDDHGDGNIDGEGVGGEDDDDENKKFF